MHMAARSCGGGDFPSVRWHRTAHPYGARRVGGAERWNAVGMREAPRRLPSISPEINLGPSVDPRRGPVEVAGRCPTRHAGLYWGARHPAAFASASEQNMRSPFAVSIFVLPY